MNALFKISTSQISPGNLLTKTSNKTAHCLWSLGPASAASLFSFGRERSQRREGPGDDLPSLEGRVCKGSRRKSSVTSAFLAERMVGRLGLGPPGVAGRLQRPLFKFHEQMLLKGMGRGGAVSFFMLENVCLNEQLHCALNREFIDFLIVWFNAPNLVPDWCRKNYSFLSNVETDLLVHTLPLTVPLHHLHVRGLVEVILDGRYL